MILQQGIALPGYNAPACSVNNSACDYRLTVGTTGSDENDRPRYLTKLYIGEVGSAQAIVLQVPAPDMRDDAATEAALNALNKGVFKVTTTRASGGDVRTMIESLQNPNLLAGIEVTYEGIAATSDEPFCQTNCNSTPICDPTITRCGYSLSRSYESTPGFTKISVSELHFSHGVQMPISPIDTANLQALSTWINNLPEADGRKFQLRYENEILYIWHPDTQYEPIKVVFRVESANILQGGTQIDYPETYFQRGDCHACCPGNCGRNGEVPCNNGINNGCNPDLTPDLNGLCRPPCRAGTAWFNGELVAAGGYGQPPDCKGNCQAGLVATPYGCRPASNETKVCDLVFNTEINQSGDFLGIKLCNLGTFRPTTPIMYGNGTAIAAWINDPTTGICPDAQPCATVTRIATATTNVYRYEIKFTGVNFNCQTTDNPIESRYEYCHAEIKSCISPTCSTQQISSDCPVGQTFNPIWLRCISAEYSCTTNAQGFTFGAVPCYTGTVTRTPEYELKRSNLINAKVAEITNDAQKYLQVKKWFEVRNLTLDLQAYAINQLVNMGGANGLPENERICFYSPTGMQITY